MGGRMSRARAARRAARVTPSPVHEEAEVVVADFSDATDSLIGFGLPSSQRRRDGASDDDDSDTMDEDALETDTGDLLGDEADEKCGIIPLDVIDVESECIVCMNDKIEMRFEPCNHEICCASCSDRLDFCPMCRAQIREVPKNQPEPEEETIDLLELISRGIIGPGDGQPREGGHIMARLSLGQLLIGLASAQEEGGRRHAAGGPLGIAAAGGGGGGGGGTRQQEALQSQRRLLLELGSLMLTRMNPAGAGGAGDDGPPMPTPTGQWACGRCTLINEESDTRCVACYAHYALSEQMHAQNGTSNQEGIAAGAD